MIAVHLEFNCELFSQGLAQVSSRGCEGNFVGFFLGGSVALHIAMLPDHRGTIWIEGVAEGIVIATGCASAADRERTVGR